MTCAFCLMTSAGVMTKQEQASASDEARAFESGCCGRQERVNS